MVIPKRHATRLKILEGGELPRPLQRTAPRDVVLSGGGRWLAALALILAVTGVAGGALLALKLERDDMWAAEIRRSGRVAEAVVTEAKMSRGDDPRLTLRYRYRVADGREFAPQVRLRARKRDASPPQVGDKVRVVYLPSDPGRSWLEGREPAGAPPVWIALLPPLAGLTISTLIFLVLWRQRKLLAEGRAAVAQVVAAEQRPGVPTTWRVTYAWRLPSGVERKVSLVRNGEPAPIGAKLAVVYDPDQPQRYAPFPLPLVRVR